MTQPSRVVDVTKPEAYFDDIGRVALKPITPEKSSENTFVADQGSYPVHMTDNTSLLPSTLLSANALGNTALPRPSINFTLTVPASIDIPVEAFYRVHRVDALGGRMGYLYATMPFADICHIQILSDAPGINWRAGITFTDALFDNRNQTYYEEVVDASTVRAPSDDEPPSSSFVHPVNPYAIDTAQNRAMTCGDSSPFLHLPVDHGQHIANVPLYDEKLEMMYFGEDKHYKVLEAPLTHPLRLVDCHSDEEVIGHNWVKVGSRQKTGALRDDNPTQATTDQRLNMPKVSRTVFPISRLRNIRKKYERSRSNERNKLHGGRS
jgi:hypothetical protein